MTTRMSLATFVVVVVAGGVYVVASQPAPDPGKAAKSRPAATRNPRQWPVRLVATWKPNREMGITWTADGKRHDEGILRISPWERDIVANAGSVVTFTVRPATGAVNAEHACVIESPPGRPAQGRGQAVGHGNTIIMCEYTVGS